MQQIDSKSNFFWNIAGSLCSATVSVLLMMIVTRTLDKQNADIFSIAWAFSQLMLTLGNFQVRVYQLTDIEEKYKFTQYFKFRIITIACMLAATLAYVLIKQYDLYKALIVFIVVLYTATGSLSDMFQGWFQQKQRFDLAGKALAARSVLPMLCFAALLFVTHDLPWGLLLLTGAAAACSFLFDCRYLKQFPPNSYRQKGEPDKKWMWNLFLTCLPLFLNGFLVMLAFNAPKNSIDTYTEAGVLASGLQTSYEIIFMPASVINLGLLALRPLIAEMAVAWSNNQVDRYFKVIRKIIALLLLFTIAALGVAWVLGIPVLSWVYGVDLSAYKKELMLIILGGGVYAVGVALDNALTVIRKQKFLVIAYTVSCAFALAVASAFVKNMGIMGAALTYMLSMFVLTFTIILLYAANIGRSVRQRKKHPSNKKDD